MDFSLITAAITEVKTAVTAVQAGKKFTAIKHGGQAAVYAGTFGVQWSGEDTGITTMTAQSFGVLEASLESASADQVAAHLESELSAPRAASDPSGKALGPIALFLIQLALRKLFERILK